MNCPRCGGKLWPESDKDYGQCIVHGSIFIGTVPVDLPPPKGRENARGHKLQIDAQGRTVRAR